MIFYLHYVLLTSGLSGASVLLAVYFKTYSDASEAEVGALLMAIPFVSLFIKPIFCSMADRQQAHHRFLMLSLVVMMLGFIPFLVVPFFPNFYQHYPRQSCYIEMLACLVGSGGLEVAWSLGDCLAMNHSQRTGVPYGRMRLMGTLSWGIYGFIIGQINEHPALPKYLPAFIILEVSVALELLLLAFWDRSVFEMVDPLNQIKSNSSSVLEEKSQQQTTVQLANFRSNIADSSCPSDGRLIDRVAVTIEPEKEPVTLQVDNLAITSSLDDTPMPIVINSKTVELDSPRDIQNSSSSALQFGRTNPKSNLESNLQSVESFEGPQFKPVARKNPQLILLKMILIEDGRLIKYLILFTMFGVFMATLNFFFVSVETLCHERGYNFSQLTGAVLMSQALIETLSFIVVPYLLNYVSKWQLLSFGLAIMSMKDVFYAGWYYSADVSPYWAVLSEWSHGIPCGIFFIIMADVSLMFANESRLFIPELRRLGYLTRDTSKLSKEALEAEERSIKMILRATIQALFGGFMEGLGMGVGSLLFGLISDLYSYHIVWQLFATLALATFALHLLIETTGSRWSDCYKPSVGSKAHEIMELSRITDEVQHQRRFAKAKS